MNFYWKMSDNEEEFDEKELFYNLLDGNVNGITNNELSNRRRNKYNHLKILNFMKKDILSVNEDDKELFINFKINFTEMNNVEKLDEYYKFIKSLKIKKFQKTEMKENLEKENNLNKEKSNEEKEDGEGINFFIKKKII
jgi:hypothetical protein